VRAVLSQQPVYKLETVSESRFTGYADAFEYLQEYAPLWLDTADYLRLHAGTRRRAQLVVCLSKELQAFFPVP
jgi:hypothetical protein